MYIVFLEGKFRITVKLVRGKCRKDAAKCEMWQAG